jgi:hypothetical protein
MLQPGVHAQWIPIGIAAEYGVRITVTGLAINAIVNVTRFGFIG